MLILIILLILIFGGGGGYFAGNAISPGYGFGGGFGLIVLILTLVANSPKSHKSLVFGLGAPMDLQGEWCRNTGRK